MVSKWDRSPGLELSGALLRLPSFYFLCSQRVRGGVLNTIYLTNW